MFISKKTMQIKFNNVESSAYKIISYSNNCFQLNDKVVQKNIVISRNRIYEDFLTDNYQDFALQQLDKLMLWKPEIIIIGSGKKLNSPNKEWADYVNKKNVGLR